METMRKVFAGLVLGIVLAIALSPALAPDAGLMQPGIATADTPDHDRVDGNGN